MHLRRNRQHARWLAKQCHGPVWAPSTWKLTLKAAVVTFTCKGANWRTSDRCRVGENLNRCRWQLGVRQSFLSAPIGVQLGLLQGASRGKEEGSLVALLEIPCKVPEGALPLVPLCRQEGPAKNAVARQLGALQVVAAVAAAGVGHSRASQPVSCMHQCDPSRSSTH
jgi:hypothetical protein